MKAVDMSKELQTETIGLGRKDAHETPGPGPRETSQLGPLQLLVFLGKSLSTRKSWFHA